MASNKFRWISAAETCHIWDESLDVIHKFDGVHGNVGDVAWSHDGRNIAFMQAVNSHIITASVGPDQIYQSTTVLSEEETATALGFSNELLVAGTASGSVVLWDQHKHKLIRKFSGVEKKPVNRIQSSNSIIAAGHSNGTISVYGMKTGQATGHYSIANSAGLRDLKISSVKTSVMAASFNSGTVAAWNTHSKTSNAPLFEFNGAHQSPATCVVLSPVTDILMVSGGLDKGILLYDLPKKKILKRIEADAPVTAIDFFPDGTSLIVGTNRGKVLIYDLRSISTPIRTITAHSSSVSKIICRPYQGRLENVTKKTSVKPNVIAEKNSSSKANPPLSTSESSDKSSHFPFRAVDSQVESQFVGGPSPITPVRNGAPNRVPEFPPSMDPTAATKEMERRNSSLFSPLKGETSDTMFSSPSLTASPFLKYNKTRDYRTQEETVHSQPLINEETREEIETQNPACTTEPLAPPPPFLPTLDGRDDSPLPPETTEPASAAAAVTSSSVGANAPVDFQAEFIRRIVHDVEENLREVLRCRFGDLIIQSAQQFLTLQNEIEQLRQQVQDKAYLEEEVRRLRNEVNQLRNLY